MEEVKELIYNEDNIKEDEIDEVVIRVKLLMINDSKQLLLGYCGGAYQFPGGHLHDDEDCIVGLKREVKEETGIEINVQELIPFFVIKRYIKNYNENNLNRLNLIYYFFIRGNEKVRYDNTNFDEYEKEANYEAMYVDLENIEDVLKDNIPNNKNNECIVEEMLEVIKYVKDNLII